MLGRTDFLILPKSVFLLYNCVNVWFVHCMNYMQAGLSKAKLSWYSNDTNIVECLVMVP